MTRAYPLVRTGRAGLDDFAEQAGVHPELVRRFVALGLLEADRDATGRLWFQPTQVVTVARIRRLHNDLALNYAAIGLVLDLLDEIERLRHRPI